MRVLMKGRRWSIALLVLCLAAPVLMAAPQTPGRPARGERPDRLREVDATSAADLRTWDAEIGRMVRGRELRLRASETDALVDGRIHQRFDQYHQGVRVFGGELVRQLDGAETVSVFGTVYPAIDIDTTPTLGAEDAAAVASALGGTDRGPARTPDLMVVPSDAGGFALAYRVRLATDDNVMVYFIDAHTGALVSSYSDLQTEIGTGTGVLGDQKKVSTTFNNGIYRTWDQMRPATIYTFDLKGDLTRTQDFLYGVITLGVPDTSASTDNTWTDPAAVDAHAYTGWTFDYFYKRFGRSGLDGRNLTIKSVVHPVVRADWNKVSSSTLNLYYLNAFYAGDGIMVYGEGLPPDATVSGYKWNYFAGALDVVAHELTHGVTDYSSGLIYQNESGALNESFSDMMGTSVEFYYQPVGSAYLKADYTLGEDLTTPMGGFRSMANPGAFGDPDHYSKRYTGKSDNGGVHTNSGISNHAFYLAIEGGTDRTSGLSVTGVGSASRDKIEKVFYRAFTQMLPAGATFSVARAATIQAARDLYGAGSNVEQAVTQAWTAVGVS
ncbi:MAG: M4 family metallopeptidase [Acidobacteria bacterium]|nr:M4 family metallopeptidase [Acidobacteriota bacterium]